MLLTTSTSITIPFDTSEEEQDSSCGPGSFPGSTPPDMPQCPGHGAVLPSCGTGVTPPRVPSPVLRSAKAHVSKGFGYIVYQLYNFINLIT